VLKMDVGFKEVLIAIVTTKENSVSGGSVPTFYAENHKDQERIALLLSKITKGMIHDLENGCYIIVRH